jgi:hypothetical protein
MPSRSTTRTQSVAALFSHPPASADLVLRHRVRLHLGATTSSSSFPGPEHPMVAIQRDDPSSTLNRYAVSSGFDARHQPSGPPPQPKYSPRNIHWYTSEAVANSS